MSHNRPADMYCLAFTMFQVGICCQYITLGKPRSEHRRTGFPGLAFRNHNPFVLQGGSALWTEHVICRSLRAHHSPLLPRLGPSVFPGSCPFSPYFTSWVPVGSGVCEPSL